MSSSESPLPLEGALQALAASGHVCSIDESELEQLELIVTFVCIGLERGEKCVYIADKGNEGRIEQTLYARGIDVGAALKTKALVFMSLEDAHLEGDSFDPYRMFTLWKDLNSRAREEGFARLRGASDMRWILRADPGPQRWLAYEQQLTQLAADSECLLLCQYYRPNFRAEQLLDVIRTHLTVIHRGTVAQNIYYVPSESASQADPYASELENLLNDIRRREHADYVPEITEAKRAAAELRRSVAYLADGQRVSHTGSWGWDVASQEVSFWSLEHFRIFGLDPKVKPTYELIRPLIHPDDVAFIEVNFARAVREHVGYDHEFRILRSDGQLRHLRSVGHPVFDDRGTLVEYAGTIVDCTEQKLAEATLRATQSELVRVSRLTSLGELTASIAHEVNQPLAAIIAHGGAARRWLGRTSPNVDEAARAIEGVIENARRAHDVIARIRALARKAENERELLDLNDIIREILALADGELRQNSVTLRTDFASTLPRIFGDRVQLQQVALNLIMNGVEAICELTEGSREIVIRTALSERKELYVAVQDSGVGLPEEDLQAIFEPFYTTKSQGMGMGLSISRSIIQAHNGRLWAERNKGTAGITVHFTLPVREGFAAEADPGEPRA
jgi:PAS domain S-box-containing protein